MNFSFESLRAFIFLYFYYFCIVWIGGYVGVVPAIDDSPTIMIDQNELTQRINTPKKDQKIQQEEPLKDEIIALLHDFKDCFAWHYHEMPGLDRGLMEHKLSIKEGCLWR